jgi:hypothetical protein
MGHSFSKTNSPTNSTTKSPNKSNTFFYQKPVNYRCPVCIKKNDPNLLGAFFIINDKECQCNGCNTIFLTSQFYK